MKESRLGHPRYMWGDQVIFYWDNGCEKDHEMIGRIEVVDAYGTMEQSEEPSYDIGVIQDGIKILYKHVRESNIHLF